METAPRTALTQQVTDDTLDHVLVAPSAGGAATVLVVHGMEGRSDAQLAIADQLTEWGHQAVAVDLFGTAVTRGGPERCAAEMQAYLADRAALGERLTAVLSHVLAAPRVDAARVAAIGFCFGGLCVLDIARAGHDLRSVASFHGILTPPADAAAPDITAKVAVFHGWDDPFAPPQDVVAIGQELTRRRADWQLHAYGDAMHAFMAPFADQPDRGIQYNAVVAGRAWRVLGDFLHETLAR
ncbi:MULTISPECIES: dienelactone hydrolase family protein [Mycobacteriaceae]|uniref:dienelactone hydrolase family protein n=1 Tax=Mycobacteriaceae TaxID=1762 RepID=UPI0007FBF211|nr:MULTISPECIES: dienelactone hydrolase family protein [Mycobacteriaceae]MCK0176115.1 dienelactone hydrolase family protein [Mycolicibacterium sp. F2034L]OBB58260.1 carboxymethylenebutenolidase [Mycobacterium sp. 852013-51886_SCH5428379]